MERLYIALEKARAARGQRQSDAQPLRLDEMEATAVPDASSVEIAAKVAASPAPSVTWRDWSTLDKLEIDRRRLHRNRIATLEGGTDSAPFDLLRTRMLQQARQHGWRRIALVSPHAGCGKSTTALNLAFSLSRQREIRSILFDFDLRRAGLSEILGKPPSQGMADVLERKADFTDTARRHGPNTAFGLNSGSKHGNVSEILQSAQTTEVLDEIDTEFSPDILLFDMPPLLASDDNFGFLQNVDCALILAAAEKTPMSQIDVAERHVAELTTVMGIVLNKCRYKSRTHSHEYDYY